MVRLPRTHRRCSLRPATKTLQGVGDKPADRVRIAQHVVACFDLLRDFVWLDAALPKEAALALLTLGRLVPGGVQPADIGGRQRPVLKV
jgi:hypothetical protein